MWALRLRLGGLLFAALGAAFFLTAGIPEFAGWAALTGFLLALCAELYTAIAKPDRRWYQGRAAAESAKTLAWRYAVCGDRFEAEASGVDRVFVNELREILKDLRDLDLSSATNATEQITPRMRELRARSFEDRKRVFAEGRIEDQRGWYARKSQWNAVRLQRWTVAVITAEGLGVLGGVLVVAYSWSIDLVGLLAAVAAAITAWVQAKQHGNLATAYGITSQELASIYSTIASVSEAEWPEFVGQSEEAISREHTLWRATRGV